ncbi:helix-turn-helix domain-containing protein [Streptomyces mirabilis]|uniref:PucR family transcriptional regulator n=1 Tax=Streptomyces mirabilis TaxID=68239 RepID=UPI0036D91235
MSTSTNDTGNPASGAWSTASARTPARLPLLVGRILGPLAVDNEQCAQLRATLQDFLTTGCSYTATASNEILHKNTVHYRIRKAEKIMGHSVQAGHADLEVALLAVKYLGSTVIQPSGGGTEVRQHSGSPRHRH